MDYPYYIPPYLDGGDYVRAHGLPSSSGFMDVKIPSAPVMDPIQSGLQFGLLGAASGLGYTAVNRAVTGRKPGGWRTARNITAGALLGAVFGALAAKENRTRFGGTSVNNYSAAANNIFDRMYKSSELRKDAFLPLLLPIAMAGLSAWSAADALRSGGKTIGALARGNWRQAAGHGLATLGNAAMAIPGAGSVVRVAKGVRMLRPMIRPMQRGLNTAARLNNRMMGQYATTRFGRMAMPAATIGGAIGAQTAGGALTASGMTPRPAPRPAPRFLPESGGPAIGASLLRMVPSPQTPQFRTLV